MEQTESKRDFYKKGLTVEDFRKWVEHFKDDPEVKRLAQNLKKLHNDVFVRFKVDQIEFELPEKLDKQMYMKIYRKIWATLRHDLWVRIQEQKKNKNSGHISKDEFSKLYTEVHETFETVRMEIYNKIMGEDVERHVARENMQKAYITFATLSGVTSEDGSAVRSRWADQVTEAAHQHGEYIEEFEKGVFYSNISEDPRDTIESDEKISLAHFAGYSKSKTLAPKGIKQNEVEMSEQAEAQVKRIA